ncbi:poly [ADP-ribose] polymerase 1 isoform X1 [Salmo salar]|uniref:Poly [ADP-ribose] polymerase n=2 Tax=Salmo salar TaxID=8030 RepID=A0A1S3S9Z7_SALSA|nr:poly [ADP-ribose] polymerase 1 isoform X1 [Salmo salar]|eukprot:XP_014061166.1 PREDICTED: poly [ADP-ribose] polymerase 1 isoform X1 [Salmo salar]
MADAQEDKLYKAEYAKSGRASCKKCKENIAKDSLRMAIMVQSPMFDGKVPHWHHFSCFWLRASAQSPADIAGFSDLRWEDQEKVKKAIETGGAAGGKGDVKGGAKGEKTLNDFAVEYAKSNRSTCKGCEQKIEKDQIRVSKKTVDPEKPQLGLIDRWYHTACFVGRREELVFKPEYSAAQLKGFNTLRVEDKEELKRRLPAVKSKGKRKTDEVDGEGASKKKKDEEEEKKKVELQMKEQSQLIWGIKDKLRQFCSTNDMKELLIANGQEVPSGESNVVDSLGDCMAFGALKPCEECQGQLVFKSDAYYCTGDLSAWTKCVFKTQLPNRKDWVIPKEFHELPFLKKFKFKRQDRVFPKVAPAPPPASSAAVPCASSAPSIPLPEGAPADKPLTGMKLLTVGKLRQNKDELKAAVEELGGKITGTANKATLCLSTKKEVEKMSKKMEEAEEVGVRVVSEDFLTDIKSSGKALQELVSLHAISPWGAEVKLETQAQSAASRSGAMAGKSTKRVKEEEGVSKASKKMKLTVKGGAAVDPDSGLENSAHVLDQNGKIFSATLGLVDIVRGTNSYYKLQLLEDDVHKRYWVFRSWGRVGTTIGGKKLDKFNDKNSAMDNFLGVYEEKTGNAWGSSHFTKYPNRFYPLEIDYGQDEEAVKRLTASAGTNSLLAKPVQELIRTIFDVESMKKAMVEFEIDLQKMPLGKLSKRQIQSAYALLSEVQQAVSDSSSESHILDLSNRFYTLIPHDFGMKKPPLLRNLDYIQAKVQMLDNLLDIEVAYSLLKGGAEDNKKDPIDINYEKLKTKIEVVDKTTKEAEIILQYVKNTHAATHNTYTLEVEEIFKIVREGEYQKYRPFQDLPNRQLLWHGSRATNYAGILSQGLRIAPPEAPVTGYMFGKGVYFADMVSKSANYCHTSQSDPTGLLLLGEVALGNMHELKKASHITKLPKGKHSVKGLGRNAPDPSATVTLDGVQVPLGKGTNTNIDDTSLLYNEYIVYDVAQVNLKYLLKIKFNYQMSMW